MGKKIIGIRKIYQENKDYFFTIGSVALIVLMFYITGIGCPIKFLTGISCAGCGMTRAWKSVLMFDFKAAVSYHPLFWLVPVWLVIAFFKKKIDRRVYMGIAVLTVFILLLVYVWRITDLNNSVVSFEPDKGLVFRLIDLIKGE